MEKILELARNALANAVALARMVKTSKPGSELSEAAEHVEKEAIEIVQAIDTKKGGSHGKKKAP